MVIYINNVDNFYINGNQGEKVYFKYNQIWPPVDYSQEYLTLQALESGTFTWTDLKNNRSISYSTNNGSTWTTLTSGSSTPTIAANSKVLLKGNIGSGVYYDGTSQSGNGTISSSGRFNAMGNVMSLVGGDNFNNLTTISNIFQFCALFKDCTKLVDITNLCLPATTLADGCYDIMFEGCTSLVNIPSNFLPATNAPYLCYHRMFYGCTSLVNGPSILPATTLSGYYCYGGMFQECTSLTSAPELPATTLIECCYEYMFQGCTSLTSAPELPAAELKAGCYRYMLSNCPSLNYIKCLATDISAGYCTGNWTDNVAQTGTFIKKSNTTWTTGVDGIPSGWTVQNV